MRHKFFKYTITTAMALLVSLPSGFAQASGNSFGENFFGKGLVYSVAAVVVIAFLLILRMFYTMMEIQKRQWMEAQGLDYTEASEKLSSESSWGQMMKSLTDAKPISQEQDILLDHDYDGIQELDNSLPPWWVAMFYMTIIFAVVYLGYYHFSGNGWSSAGEFEQEMALAEEAKIAAAASTSGGAVDFSTASTDEGTIKAGESIFKSTCASCHGPQGQGIGTAPNLTDEYWRHGGSFKDVYATIYDGVIEKGMASWGPVLGDSKVHKVASYIKSVAGTNPPNPIPLIDRDVLYKEEVSETEAPASTEEAAPEGE